jgi:hypothetical protein
MPDNSPNLVWIFVGVCAAVLIPLLILIHCVHLRRQRKTEKAALDIEARYITVGSSLPVEPHAIPSLASAAVDNAPPYALDAPAVIPPPPAYSPPNQSPPK